MQHPGVIHSFAPVILAVVFAGSHSALLAVLLKLPTINCLLSYHACMQEALASIIMDFCSSMLCIPST